MSCFMLLVLAGLLVATTPWRATDAQSFEMSALLAALLMGALLVMMA